MVESSALHIAGKERCVNTLRLPPTDNTVFTVFPSQRVKRTLASG